jgi:type IV secretory pathway TrbL component
MQIRPPTRQEIRFGAYILALCALLIIGSLSYGVIHKVNQGDAIVRTAESQAAAIHAQATEIHDLSLQVAAARAASAAAAKAAVASARSATVQRRNQRALTRAMIAALVAHGIPVPRVVFTSRAGSSRPKVSRPSRPNQNRPARGSPGPTGSTLTTELCSLLPVPMLCP